MPHMTVFTLRGSCNKFSGNTINFVQRLDKFVTILPRLPSQLKVLIIRGPGSNLANHFFEVNVDRIRNFCYNAKKYKLAGWDQIHISEENLEILKNYNVNDLPMLDCNSNNVDTLEDCLRNENEDDEREEMDYQFMIKVPERAKLESSMIQEFLAKSNNDNNDELLKTWPEQSDEPVNEWKEQYLAAKCFPTLFAHVIDGVPQGDPTDKARIRPVTQREQISYLLKVAYKKDGRWIYPYAEHPRFAFWCLNMLHRHRACDLSEVLLNQNEEEYKLDIETVQATLNNNDYPPSFVRKLQRYAQSITG